MKILVKILVKKWIWFSTDSLFDTPPLSSSADFCSQNLTLKKFPHCNFLSCIYLSMYPSIYPCTSSNCLRQHLLLLELLNIWYTVMHRLRSSMHRIRSSMHRIRSSMHSLDLACTGLNLACTSLDLACTSLDLACTGLDLACTSLDLACTCLDLACTSLDLACTSLDLACTSLDLACTS